MPAKPKRPTLDSFLKAIEPPKPTSWLDELPPGVADELRAHAAKFKAGEYPNIKSQAQAAKATVEYLQELGIEKVPSLTSVLRIYGRKG